MPSANKLFTWLWLGLAVAILISVRWHLMQMPLERDEGEYALGGWLILRGKMPYTDFHNMKVPGIYLVNALCIFLFGGGETGPHLGLMIFQLGTLALLFLLARRWVSDALAALAVLCTALMILSPAAVALAGHATHYVSFFAVLATLLFTVALARTQTSVWLWMCAGMAAAMALLMKQQGAFVGLGLGLALVSEWLRRRLAFRQLLVRAGLLLGGFALPLAAVVAWLGANGALGDAFFWAFRYAGAYAKMLPLNADTVRHVGNSVLGMTTGIWLFWLLGVAGALLVVVRRQPLARSGLPALMLALTLVSVAPGFYFRPHYFIVCFPFLALSVVNWLHCHGPNLRRWGLWFSLLALGPTVGMFHQVWWVADGNQASAMVYGNSLFVQARRVAAYLRIHGSPSDKVLVLGSEPEICYLAEIEPATPFLYWYTHDDDQRLQPQLRAQFKVEANLSASSTRWVVMVNDPTSLYHYPAKPNESVKWINEHIRLHQYQRQWLITPRIEERTRQRFFELPTLLEWAEFEGAPAQTLQLPGQVRHITVLKHP